MRAGQASAAATCSGSRYRYAHPARHVPASLRDRSSAAVRRPGPGPWALGPTFVGSELIKADADLIAAGLLLELRTSTKLSLGITDLLRVIGRSWTSTMTTASLSRASSLPGTATWPPGKLGALLSELSGYVISVQSARDEFRGLLLACGMSHAGDVVALRCDIRMRPDREAHSQSNRIVASQRDLWEGM